MACRYPIDTCVLWSTRFDYFVWWTAYVPADSVLLRTVCHLQRLAGNDDYGISVDCNYMHCCLFQGLYALVVYFFVSLHTLTWKHKHYPMKEDLEPATLPEEPEFVADSYPSMNDSQQSLNPQVRINVFVCLVSFTTLFTCSLL